MGILFHFRSGQNSDKGIIGALVVWGLGTTMFTYPVTVSLQSVTSHENMATVTALSYTMYRIGSAVGSAVSGAISVSYTHLDVYKRQTYDMSFILHQNCESTEIKPPHTPSIRLVSQYVPGQVVVLHLFTL